MLKIERGKYGDSFFESTAPVALMGGFCCSLTMDERNQWLEYVNTTDAHREYKLCEVQWYILSNTGRTEASLSSVLARKHEADVAMYFVAKNWFFNIRVPTAEAKESGNG